VKHSVNERVKITYVATAVADGVQIQRYMPVHELPQSGWGKKRLAEWGFEPTT
jgi:hypothetical protein